VLLLHEKPFQPYSKKHIDVGLPALAQLTNMKITIFLLRKYQSTPIPPLEIEKLFNNFRIPTTLCNGLCVQDQLNTGKHTR